MNMKLKLMCILILMAITFGCSDSGIEESEYAEKEATLEPLDADDAENEYLVTIVNEARYTDLKIKVYKENELLIPKTLVESKQNHYNLGDGPDKGAAVIVEKKVRLPDYELILYIEDTIRGTKLPYSFIPKKGRHITVTYYPKISFGEETSEGSFEILQTHYPPE